MTHVNRLEIREASYEYGKQLKELYDEEKTIDKKDISQTVVNASKYSNR